MAEDKKEEAYTLVLLRHGESEWNAKGLFTGWVDVDLAESGKKEAAEAGELLKKEGFTFDVAYTSVLKRAIRTLWTVLDKLDLMWIPVFRSWRLNERMYGALQGMNKKDTAAKFGEDQVKIWRRSYATPPPPIDPANQYSPTKDPRYKDLPASDVPLCEALKNTSERFLPFWNDTIAPMIKTGKKVIVAAHGNSLRSLVAYLDGMSEAEVIELNIPTGVPLVYKLDKDLKPIDPKLYPANPKCPMPKGKYLGDPAAVMAKIDAVAHQASKKPADGEKKEGEKKCDGKCDCKKH